MPLLALLLLLLLAGGITAGYYRDQIEQLLFPPPPPPPVAVVQPPADPCASAQGVISGACPTTRLQDLPPEQMTWLAIELLRHGGERANSDALALLRRAQSNAHHGPAAFELAKLYDPARFSANGPISAADPGQALELYNEATTAGVADAAALRSALIARLRTDAAGDGAAALAARQALSRAGIN